MIRPQKKVLIVDDEPRNRKLLEALVQGQGHATSLAENGREALAQLALEVPDLIMLDLMMPGIDGFDVVRQIKTHPVAKDVPIVMVTAVDDAGSRVRLQSAGIAEFIYKPIDRWTVEACLERLLGRE